MYIRWEGRPSGFGINTSPPLPDFPSSSYSISFLVSFPLRRSFLIAVDVQSLARCRTQRALLASPHLVSRVACHRTLLPSTTPSIIAVFQRSMRGAQVSRLRVVEVVLPLARFLSSCRMVAGRVLVVVVVVSQRNLEVGALAVFRIPGVVELSSHCAQWAVFRKNSLPPPPSRCRRRRAKHRTLRLGWDGCSSPFTAGRRIVKVSGGR